MVSLVQPDSGWFAPQKWCNKIKWAFTCTWRCFTWCISRIKQSGFKVRLTPLELPLFDSSQQSDREDVERGGGPDLHVGLLVYRQSGHYETANMYFSWVETESFGHRLMLIFVGPIFLLFISPSVQENCQVLLLSYLQITNMSISWFPCCVDILLHLSV